MQQTITPTIIQAQKQGLKIPSKLIRPFLNGSFLTKFIVFSLRHKLIIEPMDKVEESQLENTRLKAVEIMDNIRQKTADLSLDFDTTQELRQWRYEHLSA